MLFNSFVFILGFLPVVVLGFHLLGTIRPPFAKAWLIAASLFFYGWWNPVYVPLIVGAMVVNYGIGRALIARRESQPRALLAAGITANLCLLGWFKYSAFVVNNVAALTGASFHLQAVALPLAISFFTFQKIAFLVDAYQGRIDRCNFPDYCLFVTFFPQLIAGPIVHYREIAPQIEGRETFRLRAENAAIGLTLFAFGLFKKVALADSVAMHAKLIFNAAASGKLPGAAAAWSGALAYTLQLYFDFSGYSDMAIGLARIFNIRLPVNFASPYKSASIAEFWRRWHITLSTFLRDYLYIPLGGNRKGSVRRGVNLFLTMLLGGLWHGAGWTFVFWGALHGAYLTIHRAWRDVIGRGESEAGPRGWRRIPGVALTFLAVVIGWVFFRADDFHTATVMLSGMAGLHAQAAALPTAPWPMIAALLAIVWFAPNSQQLLSHFTPALFARPHDHAAPQWAERILWKPGFAWAVAISLAIAWSLTCLSRPSQFLYFQF